MHVNFSLLSCINSHPHATNVDGGSLETGDCQHLMDDPETVNWQIEEEKGDKMKERVHPAQNSFRLKRNVSMNSQKEVGGWVKSRLSLYSNSSGTSGIGSISTYQSQLDLSIRPASPAEQSHKLSLLSGSMSSSMAGNNGFRSKSQRERGGKNDKAQDRGTFTRGRNVSWTNARLFQRMRWLTLY